MFKQKLKLIAVLSLVVLTSFMFVGCKSEPLSENNAILISLTPEASNALHASGKFLTTKDFPEYDFKKVEHISNPCGYEYVKCVYALTLRHKGKQNVLDAVELLLLRDDIERAGPYKVATGGV